MTVVEYTLTGGGRTPDWISDGGYWSNPEDQKMIGVGVEGSIPDSIETFTLAELQARQRTIQVNYPLQKSESVSSVKQDSDNMVDDEVNDVIKEWWDARN